MEKAKQELLDKAYELGFEYEKVYRGCSQCVIAAIQDTLDIRDDSVFKAGTGLAGGGGLTGIGVCGGYVGAVMVLSQLVGRERSNFEDPESIRFKKGISLSVLLRRILTPFPYFPDASVLSLFWIFPRSGLRMVR